MIRPQDIRPVGENELLIIWEDGHRSLYAAKDLRLQCACAYCVDEWTGVRVLVPDAIPADIRVREWSPVGHYGIRFQWSDGHNTGIYSFENLRRLCRCPSCAPGSGESPA
jgi:DUF971 family protein